MHAPIRLPIAVPVVAAALLLAGCSHGPQTYHVHGDLMTPDCATVPLVGVPLTIRDEQGAQLALVRTQAPTLQQQADAGRWCAAAFDVRLPRAQSYHVTVGGHDAYDRVTFEQLQAQHFQMPLEVYAD